MGLHKRFENLGLGRSNVPGYTIPKAKNSVASGLQTSLRNFPARCGNAKGQLGNAVPGLINITTF